MRVFGILADCLPRPSIMLLMLIFGFYLFSSSFVTAEDTHSETGTSQVMHQDSGGLSHDTGHGGGHDEGGGHGGPVIQVLLSLVIILFAAKLGGDIALRFGQPEVLGELIVGVILGNLALVGYTGLAYLAHDGAISILSELGVILLLFEVGLETNVDEMRKVGLSAFLAAVLGVVVPFFLGWGVGALFVPEAETLVHVFIGATLTATSVGITARVLKDLGKIHLPESKVILGAAVIDDVLGLLTLAVVSGIISAAETGSEMDMFGIGKIIVLAFGFLGVAVVLGQYLAPRIFKLASYLRAHGLLLAISLIVCFGISYLAAMVDLAPIVGAFTAGLILDEVHYKDLSRQNNDSTIEDLIHPITGLLVPIFFVVMGARVDLSVFGDTSVLGFAAALTLAAIIGKQVCSFGVLDKSMDKLLVGLGMIPRGEVGLIFVGIGASLTLHGRPVVDPATFGAVVIMVIVTTMVTPPILKWRLAKHAG